VAEKGEGVVDLLGGRLLLTFLKRELLEKVQIIALKSACLRAPDVFWLLKRPIP